MESEFKPSFDDKKWHAFMENTPTMFNGPFGKINLRKELVKNILVDIRDVFKFEFDVFQASQGDEGSGKSLFMAQLSYVYWWFMKELGIIDYEWSLDVCYGSLDKLLGDMDRYRFKPHMIYVLDEGDELSGENFMQPNHKRFRMEMRRGRKFARLVFLNMPQIKELTSRLVTTRCQRIFELEVDRDLETFDIERGEFKMIGIPRGRKAYSYVLDDFLPKTYIKNTLSGLLKSKDDFVEFPKNLVLLRGRYNATRVWDKDAYKRKMAEETSDVFRQGFSRGLTLKEEDALLKVMFYLGDHKLVTDIFGSDQNARRVYFLLRNKLLERRSEK